MKLFTKSEMQSLELRAQAQGLPLSRMMENAGAALADAVAAQCRPLAGRRVLILCGKGNNGGDGFVCAARLRAAGADCTVLLTHGLPATDLAKPAFARLPDYVAVLEASQAVEAIAQADVIVDCVYGFGFHGQLDAGTAGIFELCNASRALRVSADLPSGCECDTGRASAGTFMAHLTVSFTAEKPAHRSFPAMRYCGETVVAQVGIPPALINAAGTSASLTGPSQVSHILSRSVPDQDANKGSRGRLLLACGSYGMAGAAIMAARAALRCGIGLLDIACPADIYPILAGSVPEAVYTVLEPSNPEDARKKLDRSLRACTAFAVGCGLGTELSDTLCPVLLRLAEGSPRPGLLDADALNYLSRSGTALSSLPAGAVVTPHPGEAARLLGRPVPEIQAGRIPAARDLAERLGAVALLKGAATVIAAPDGHIALNPTGNPGMAKGGSGDVLSGIIGALLAQGAAPFEAAAAGAYIHGLCGDLCAHRLTSRAMQPTDLPDQLPEIFKKLERC